MLGRLAIALWLVSVAVGYLVLAGRVGQAAEGMDRGRPSYWPVGIQMISVGAASLATLIWAFQRARRTATRENASLGALGIARRGFLAGAGAIAAGLVATGGAVLACVQGWLFVTGSNMPRQLDEYLFASGRAPTTTDLAPLSRYDELIAGTHCFAHCGACLDSCPENLAIHDVLQHRMYFEDYGQQKFAMSLYAKLEKQADVCIGCAAPCVGTCPHGVPIQERTIGAHRLLTLV